MESFYSLLQKNVLNRRRWRTRDELAYAIIYWIEQTYNRPTAPEEPRQVDSRGVRTRVH